VVIDSDSELWGWLQREGLTGPISKRRFEFNLATAQKITLSGQPYERYNEGGAFTLVDGITAQEKRVSTEWLGWREGVTITVDLGSEQDISYIGIGALNETHSWIHVPNVVEFSVSNDGKTFTDLGVDLPTMNEIPLQTIDAAWRKDKAMRVIQGRHEFTTNKTAIARYVRINVQHIGNIPEGYPGAGNPAWMFLDEIEVR
jgi:hexosaminidase